LSAHDAFLE